jgi:zinc protease
VIRDKLGLTYSIGSGYWHAKGLSTMTVSSASRNETVGQMIKRTIEILRTLKAGPISPEEVQMAKEYLVGGYPLGVATLSAVAGRWLGGEVFELPPSYLNEYVPRVRAVTREEVQAAVARHFDLDHLIISVAGDGAEIRKSLKESKLPYYPVSLKDLN